MSHYSINTPDVIADNFDDETVIVNLKSGRYFSIRGKSNIVFSKILEGFSLAAISAIFDSKNTVSKEEMHQDLLQFAQKLEMLDILKSIDSAKPSTELLAIDYEKLTIEVFNDMDEVIMVDPINELVQ